MDQLKQRTTGVRRPEVSVDDLANMSLEEMAALAGEPTGEELDVAFETEGDLEAVNHLVGRFVDFLDRAVAVAVTTSSERAVRFPSPEPTPSIINDHVDVQPERHCISASELERGVGDR